MAKISEFIKTIVLPQLEQMGAYLNVDMDITSQELQEIWVLQDMRCTYSGIRLDLEAAAGSDSFPFIALKDPKGDIVASNLHFVSEFVFLRFGGLTSDEVYSWCLKIIRQLYTTVNVLDVSALHQR